MEEDYWFTFDDSDLVDYSEPTLDQNKSLNVELQQIKNIITDSGEEALTVYLADPGTLLETENIDLKPVCVEGCKDFRLSNKDKDVSHNRRKCEENRKSIELVESWSTFVTPCNESSITSISSMPIKKVMFTCDKCDYKAYRKLNLQAHINTKHTKSISSTSSNKLHIKKHKPRKKNKLFKCSYCQYKAPHRDGLMEHINLKHGKYNLTCCEYCDYKSCQLDHMEQHVNSKHAKSEIFTCAFCEYTGNNSEQIVNHINSEHVLDKTSCS